MKATELRDKLNAAIAVEENAEVVLYNAERGVYVQFSHFGMDDNNDIILDMCGGDKDH